MEEVSNLLGFQPSPEILILWKLQKEVDAGKTPNIRYIKRAADICENLLHSLRETPMVPFEPTTRWTILILENGLSAIMKSLIAAEIKLQKTFRESVIRSMERKRADKEEFHDRTYFAATRGKKPQLVSKVPMPELENIDELLPQSLYLEPDLDFRGSPGPSRAYDDFQGNDLGFYFGFSVEDEGDDLGMSPLVRTAGDSLLMAPNIEAPIIYIPTEQPEPIETEIPSQIMDMTSTSTVTRGRLPVQKKTVLLQAVTSLNPTFSDQIIMKRSNRYPTHTATVSSTTVTLDNEPYEEWTLKCNLVENWFKDWVISRGRVDTPCQLPPEAEAAFKEVDEREYAQEHLGLSAIEPREAFVSVQLEDTIPILMPDILPTADQPVEEAVLAAPIQEIEHSPRLEQQADRVDEQHPIHYENIPQTTLDQIITLAGPEKRPVRFTELCPKSSSKCDAARLFSEILVLGHQRKLAVTQDPNTLDADYIFLQIL